MKTSLRKSCVMLNEDQTKLVASEDQTKMCDDINLRPSQMKTNEVI